MKRKSIMLISALLLAALLFAIKHVSNKQDQQKSSNKCKNSNNQTEIIQETNNYTIEKQGMLYYYTIFDKNKNVLFEGGPTNRAPSIIMLSDNIVKVINQAGTGISTQSCSYFDVEQLLASPVYLGVLAEHNGILAYATYDKIVVCDFFNKEAFYKEISTFSHPLSQVAFPFVGAEFLNDGSCLRVSYLTGNEYIEADDIFELRGQGDGSPVSALDGQQMINSKISYCLWLFVSV